MNKNINSCINLKLNLVISCFITYDRNKIQGDRLKEFLATLHSYGHLKLNKVFIFVKVDKEFAPYKDEIEYVARSSMDYQTIEIIFERITSRSKWQEFFSNKLDDGSLWWFSQNDDHPYINIDADYFHKILSHLKIKNKPSAIYLSHWPEILRLASNQESLVVTKNFLEFKGLLLDSIQIFNEEMLKYIFYELNWPNEMMTRIDTIGISANITKNDFSVTCHDDLPTIIVPLKELCRKFRGYDHVNFGGESKLQFFSAVRPIGLTQLKLSNYITASHQSQWRGDDATPVSNTILNKILEINSKSLLPLDAQRKSLIYLIFIKIRLKIFYLKNFKCYLKRIFLKLLFIIKRVISI